MDLGLRNKVAIVCASSRGLGKAVALGLAEEGVNLTICARGDEELQRTDEEIRSKSNVQVLAIQGDVAKPADIRKIVTETLNKFLTIHILVNNAGGPPLGNFMDFTPDDWQKALELNLLSTINFIREVIPVMRKQNWGRVINITSVAVKQPIEGLILSNTARAGIVGLTKTLSNEFARENILFNNVCPGRILTDRILELARARADKTGMSIEDVFTSMENDIPIGRIGKPRELADLVVFLASERASYITGTTIQVDGGIVKGII
jgi:3-oxoacyl-[acyl-carrier protein] reductase